MLHFLRDRDGRSACPDVTHLPPRRDTERRVTFTRAQLCERRFHGTIGTSSARAQKMDVIRWLIPPNSNDSATTPGRETSFWGKAIARSFSLGSPLSTGSDNAVCAITFDQRQQRCHSAKTRSARDHPRDRRLNFAGPSARAGTTDSASRVRTFQRLRAKSVDFL